MTEQSLLKTIKRWRRYEKRGDWSVVPSQTRGFYVLYKERAKSPKRYDVVYIGVAGLKKGATSGIRSRLKSHDEKKDGWSHFSFFEVHDNITSEDIRELEGLLLTIFRHDPRIRLQNIQKGSRTLYRLRHRKLWPPQ